MGVQIYEGAAVVNLCEGGDGCRSRRRRQSSWEQGCTLVVRYGSRKVKVVGAVAVQI